MNDIQSFLANYYFFLLLSTHNYLLDAALLFTVVLLMVLTTLNFSRAQPAPFLTCICYFFVFVIQIQIVLKPNPCERNLHLLLTFLKSLINRNDTALCWSTFVKELLELK